MPVLATLQVTDPTVRLATAQRLVQQVQHLTATRTILAPLQIVTPPALVIPVTRTLPPAVVTQRPPPVLITRLATAFRQVQQLNTFTLPAIPTTVQVVVPQPFTLLTFTSVLGKPMTPAECSKEIVRDSAGTYRAYCASRTARRRRSADGPAADLPLGHARGGHRRRAVTPDRLSFCSPAAIADGCNTLLNGASTSTPAPAATTSTPAPAATTSTPAPVPTTSTPAPAATTSTPAPAATTTTPAPAATTTPPAPAATTSTPAATTSTPAPAATLGLRKADTTCGNGGITWFHHALEQPRNDLTGDPYWSKFDPTLYDPVAYPSNALYYDTGNITSLGYWTSKTTTAPASGQDTCVTYYGTHKAYNVQAITQRGYMFAPVSGTYTFSIYNVSSPSSASLR